MKVTMSMKTTMTTVQHRVLRLGWPCSSFPLYNLIVFRVCFGLYAAVASSLTVLYNLVLVSVTSPFVRRSDVQIFHSRLRVSSFVHAQLVLLVLNVALHDRSVILLAFGTQIISCFLELF